MRIAIINDIFSFKLASGIYVWYFHYVQLLRELGITKVDFITPCSEEKFHAHAGLETAFQGIKDIGMDFYFVEGGTSYRHSTDIALDAYLETHRPDLIIAPCAPNLSSTAYRNAKGIPLMLYQHTGQFVYKETQTLAEAYATHPHVHSVCITDLAGKILTKNNQKNVVLRQPYYPVRKAKPSTNDYMLTATGGYPCKRDQLTIDVCKEAGIPLVGLGRHPEFTLVQNDLVYKHLEHARCMMHWSTEDMVPYAFMEASQYCNIICDINQTWTHGLSFYELPVFRVDPSNIKRIREIYDTPVQKAFDPAVHRELCLDDWRRYFTNL